MKNTQTTTLIIAILILYGATIPLNISFNNYFIHKEKKPDIIENIFGGMREAIADWAFMKSEEYFHRGLTFMKAVAYHEGESALLEESMQSGKEHEELEHHHEPEVKKDLFSKIYSSVKVTGDSHLIPSEMKETVPWFYIEVRLNPHDIRGYTVGAFSLHQIGRDEEGIKFLKEAEKNNPNSASILTSIGQLYYEMKEPEQSLEYLEAARKLWLEGRPPNTASDSYGESDRFLTFDLLGELYLKKGDRKKALQIYEELYRFRPMQVFLQKITQLKSSIGSSNQ